MAIVRVSRNRPCPVCGKPDWCLVADNGGVAICARVTSDEPKGEAGWLHRLSVTSQLPNWRPVRRHEKKPTIDWLHLCKQHRRACRPSRLVSLSNQLGTSLEALIRLRVGWNDRRRAFSFPMRTATGQVCGIRYRTSPGTKFSEKHSRQGLFFLPADLVRHYLIVVEGASDTAATIDLGFPSVIGRANCRGNVEQIKTLCRRLKPDLVVIVPDSDPVGLEGGSQLAQQIEEIVDVQTLQLPKEVKDVRQCIQQKENADWLAGQIGKLIKTSQQGATSHDNHF